MIPKKVYLRAKELESHFMCERMVSCDAAIGSCNVEYTDLSQVWHDASEEPKRGSLILLIMPSGTAIVAKIIEPNHTFNHGERWAYISDLLPKGGDSWK